MFAIEKKFECGLIKLKIPYFKDKRGDFTKAYNYKSFKQKGIDFVPKEHFYSFSNKNVLRGMHFQIKESAHNKLIQCIQGSILDVCVDIRKKSIFYNKPISIKTSGASAIFIPKGFAHGFLALEDNTIVQYMADKEHDPINDKGVLWNSLDFIWPIKTPILSDRDKNHPAIGEEECIFL